MPDSGTAAGEDWTEQGTVIFAAWRPRADGAGAVAWRRHPEHAAVSEAGRGRWYDTCDLHVAHVSRIYGWTRTDRERA